MKTTRDSHRRASAGHEARWIGVLLAIGALTGCNTLDKLLAVDARNQILADKLDDPKQAPLLVISVQSTFECAFGIYIITMGMLTDELKYYGTSNPMTYYDARFFRDGTGYVGSYGSGTCDDAVNPDVYSPLNSARWLADDVLRKLDAWSDGEVPGRTSLIATAAAYAGYARVLMGEGFCSGVIDGGPQLTPQQLWQSADERFTRAISTAQASGNTDIRNMALVGRARTRLNLGLKAEAEADALLVPAGYVKMATTSAISRYRRNRAFDWSNTLRNVGVEEPFQNLTEGGVPDPRVPSTFVPGIKPMFLQMKYKALDTPIPLASWREAQLMIAEVEGGSTALGIINMFHTQAGLPAFSGTNAEIMNHLVTEERRRELWLESQHIGDMRRYSLAFLPATGTVYQGGAYSGVYGDTQCMPLPESETRNNPNIKR